ncbi:PorT family protein [Flavobacterium sp. CYK-55]|uniref:porin family protein n=1 Tax=Flavobacterium sp. CYK-55 TaxID=2835529 RepID=UPI001BCBE57C|nr:porin family protein [Flavobacterium sp. CYK-55]MBS7785930.1 PorT family protein [Flavobacterium sp. CYK-55]
MKKFTLLCALLCFSLFVHAQDKVVPKTRFGIKGGLNVASVGVKNENISGEITPKTGFHAGLFFDIQLMANKFYFRPEILYSNQGYKFSGTNLNAKINEKANINYLAIPLMFSVEPVKKLNIDFGPQVSFLLSSKSVIDYSFVDAVSGNLISGSETVDNKDETKSIEMGLNIGLSYKITSKLLVSGRYNFGLTMLNERVPNSTNPNIEVRNKVFQFSIGYLF